MPSRRPTLAPVLEPNVLTPEPLQTRPRAERRDPSRQVSLPAGLGRRATDQPSAAAPGWNASKLEPKRRERAFHLSVRVPVSKLDRIEAICAERRIDRTAFVLYAIDECLRSLESTAPSAEATAS